MKSFGTVLPSDRSDWWLSTPGVSAAYEAEVIGALHRLSEAFWSVAILFFVAGDIATSLYGFALYSQAIEAGPFVAILLHEFGLGSMFAIKAVVIAAGYGLFASLRRPERVGIPLGLAALGFLVTVWNVKVLLPP